MTRFNVFPDPGSEMRVLHFQTIHQGEPAVMREIINPAGLPAANATYSQAIRASGLVFVSGQIGTDPFTGRLVSGDIGDQTKQVMENIAIILAASGSSMAQVVSASLFLTDFEELPRVNQVYASYFPSNGPAKMACGVTALYGGAKIEIQVIALAT